MTRTSTTDPQIAVIGSNMVDLISYIRRMPKEGETLEAPDFSMGCGGKGANQAVAASRLGSRVLMVTRVGNDIFAQNTIANFERNGIDTTYVLQTEATSGVAPIFVDEESHNSILIIKGANALLTPADLEAAEQDVARCRLIVLQLEIPLETVYAAIEMGQRLGIPVLLNPAPAQPDLLLERVKGCDFLVPNESELSLLTGMPVDTEQDVRRAASVLRRAGVRHVIVTLGSRGVLWLSDDGEELLPATDTQPLDTTGAGDAFIGCFSHVLVETGDIREAIVQANAYAGDSVTKRGTQTSYATAEEFAAVLEALRG
ncbi:MULTISPECIES: ribokinase [unclassified Actinomyces]|uniref:ribokinase n=1 Tax=unclassified Actinomyces TaxID=2609248 RepID=UPI002016AA5F|nr:MULTISPECIES: ribokinase [unclassified Actinomyces]MCL3777227.1 ribokinase [Actinomyces sp. AC-20-1]MCL3789302.1 ribokinase [Actinomyces sp. 187325]MCL3791722.1 ribokinase [Actinomyces sp. 186855]MCL3794238.1 ribokinase [Actinomyces sp. 217892]